MTPANSARLTLPPGIRLGPYEIVALLGKGGMGEVYRARDPRLGREVAIKVLPEEFAQDPERLRRFEEEARSASALSDPHIVMVFDVGEANGIRFFASELVEGSNLRQLLECGSLSREKALDLAEQIASGLAAAHEKGIVHRDLKPENILITKSGLAKIGDFGLAKLVESSVSDGPTIGGHQTSAGMILGTVAYMSPEQVRGQPVDRRSDIFSFGALLYEMLTGRRAFQGDTAAETMARILRDEPEPLEQVTPDVAAPVRAIVERCLAKEPRGRYDGAHDLARDLAGSRAQLVGIGAPYAAGVAETRSRRLAAVGAVALVAVLAILSAVLVWQRRPAPPPPARPSSAQPAAAEPTSIAVLPFVNMSPDADQEYFSDGLSEELLNTLANVPQLRVISRTSSFQFKGKNEDVRTIARKLNVGRVLEGSVRRSGKRVRITAQLVDAGTGSHLWSQTYDRDLNDIFAVQDDIARSVADASRVMLLGTEGHPSTSYGSNSEAYNLYLQAKYFSRRGTREGLQKATEYYEQALKLDPGRAAYWSGLAGVHIRQVNHSFLPEAEGFRQSREEVTKALELDPNLAEAHALLGWIRLTHDWDWEGADASLKKALENGPGSAMVVANAASLAAAVGRLDEAIELYRRAIRLDPLSVAPHFNLSQAASDVGRLDEAEAALRKVLELNPEQPGAHAALGRVFLLRRRPEAAFNEIQKETLPSDRLQGLALAYHALGRKKEADAALAELVETDGDSAAVWIAEVYADRRDSAKAFEWLDRAYAQHDPELAFAKGNRLLKNLEGDPRYRAFLRKMRLPG